MGGTVFLSLAGTIDKGVFASPRRIGCFSYGSGCCSEFYSGIVTGRGQERQRRYDIAKHLNERYRLSIKEYESLLRDSGTVKFGTRNVKLDFQLMPGVLDSCRGKQRLFLEEIREYRREYKWIS
jgi:polyketide biosynthesis 3-hydroxy-3-methylglutaryl-CoA synthase-like enzyme PksG